MLAGEPTSENARSEERRAVGEEEKRTPMIDDNEVRAMLAQVGRSIGKKELAKSRRGIQRVLDLLDDLDPEKLSRLSREKQQRFHSVLAGLIYGSIQSQVSVMNYLQFVGVDLANDETRKKAIIKLVRLGAEQFMLRLKPAGKKE